MEALQNIEYNGKNLKLFHLKGQVDLDFSGETSQAHKYFFPTQKLEELRQIEKIKKQQNIVFYENYYYLDNEDTKVKIDDKDYCLSLRTFN